MAVERAGDNITVLLQPQSVLLPARLVPILLVLGPGRGHMAGKNSLHAAIAQDLELDAQPVHVLVAGLRGLGAAVDACVAVEEVHCVEAEDGKTIGNDLDEEPTTKLKGVALLLGDEAVPDIAVEVQPPVGARIEDVVGEEVIVAKRGDNGDVELVAGGKGLEEFVGNDAVCAQDLLGAAWVVLVAVVTGRVASPDDEVNVVLDISGDPVKGGIDERERRVTVRRLGAKGASKSMAAVASDALLSGRVNFVELIGVKIYRRL
jgi:hypothetical protein